jgi:5-methylcytosine-specific restriction protein A
MCWHIVRWNPKHYAWNDLYEDIELLKTGTPVIKKMECRGPNCIKKGNGFFLVRQGEEPKGIIGSGYIINCSLAGAGLLSFEARFDLLLPPVKEKMLSRDYLKYMYPYIHWDTPKTGTAIDDDIAEIILGELAKKKNSSGNKGEAAYDFSAPALQMYVDNLLPERL